jgi:hypothetical protein
MLSARQAGPKKMQGTLDSGSFGKALQSANRSKRAPGLYRKESALAVWALGKNLPFQSFEGPDWERVQQEHGFTGGSRHTLRAILDPMYLYVSRALMAQLRQQDAFSVGFDMWSDITKRHFLGITYHWIDNDWRSHSHLLDLIAFPAEATGRYIADVIDDRVNVRVPPEESDAILVSAVSDRGSNALKARRLLADDDAEHCLPHLVKSAMDDIIVAKADPPFSESFNDVISTDITSLTQLLSWIKTKPANRTALTHFLPHHLKHLELRFPNDTRWEGRLRMVTRAIELREGIDGAVPAGDERHDICETCGGPPDFLQDNFWGRLTAYATCFGHVNNFSLRMQSNRASKASVLRKYCELIASLSEETDSFALSASQNSFVAALQRRFLPLFQCVNNTTKAAVLDPSNYPQINDWLQPDIIEGTWQAMEEELESYIINDPERLETTRSGLRRLRNLVPSIVVTGPDAPTDEGDALLWGYRRFFQQKDKKYLKMLSPLLKGILCIPTSSAKCERVFSYTTLLVNRLTSQLSVDTVEIKAVIHDAIAEGTFDFEEFIEFATTDEIVRFIEQLVKEARAALETEENERNLFSF